MNPRRQKKTEPEPSGHVCAWAGCGEAGDYKAPRSRTRPGDYQWMCLDHVREFNKNWNYFEGMSQDEIYDFQKEAVLGHRPTWKSATTHTTQDLGDAVRRFFGHGEAPLRSVPKINARDKQALAVLDLEHPAERTQIKERYRVLVKKHHPDVNGGSPLAEEAFKRITQAYEHLLRAYAKEE